MRNLTRLALTHRTVTLLAVVLALAASIGGAFGLQQELFPSIQPPFVVVVATQPGAGPVAVAEDVSEPIEEAVRTTADLEQVQSSSQEGVSVIFAEYTYGTDVEDRLREVRDAIADASLPDDVSTPEVSSITPDALPIYSLALTGGGEGEAARIAEDELAPDIEGLDGVAEVGVDGAGAEVVEINLDPARLASTGVTVADVVTTVNAAQLSVPVGTITEQDTTLPVRVVGPQIDTDALVNLRVPPGAAIPGAAAQAAAAESVPPEADQAVPPEDVEAAAVDEAPQPPRIGQLGEVTATREATETISRLDGAPAVTLQVRKEQDANTVETVERIEEAIEDADLPGAIDTTVIVDQAPEITRGVSDVTRDAIIGAVLALLMIVVFLRSARGTIVASISIPLSLIAALGLMRLTGVTINILTLGALAIASGRVVDDAIVVLENTYRHLEAGVPLRDAVRRGAAEVTGAITSATLTAVAVFAPLAFISGLVGEVFLGFALTTTFALLASLVVATTVVPVFGSLLLSRAEAEKADPQNSPLRRAVRRPLSWALDHRGATVAIAVVALAGSIASLTQVPVNLFPTAEAENIIVEVDAAEGTSLQATADLVTGLEERVADTDGVESYTTVVGSPTDGVSAAFGGGGGASTAIITAAVDEDANADELREALNADLEELGLSGSVVEQSAIPTGSDATVQISGENFDDVTATTDEVRNELASVDGLDNLTSNLAEARPELTVDVRDDDARAAGLDATAVSQFLGTTLNATTATSVNTDSGERNIVVLVDPAATDSAADLRNLPLLGDTTLGDVADVNESDGPAGITRADGRRSAEVSATIIDENIGLVTADINAALDEIDPPDGITVQQVGGNEEIGESFQDLFTTMAIAVGLVYLILVATFGSLLTPFVILLTLPLAAIGAFPALAVTGRELGLPAMIGLLMLIGIVITNAIVLLEFVEQRRRDGMRVRQALVDGAETRIRPILMTALTTMFGLVPLALGLSEGALLSASLATVVIGGLLSSTLLTLVVIPVVYSLFAGGQERLSRERRPPSSERPASGATTDVPAATRPTVPPRTAQPGAGVARSGEQLVTVGRFTTRQRAEAALEHLASVGIQVDQIRLREAAAPALQGRTVLSRIAAGWLSRREPLLLSPPGITVWELGAPPAFAATARMVLENNGQAISA